MFELSPFMAMVKSFIPYLKYDESVKGIKNISINIFREHTTNT
jgi:hypothetical protein